MESSSFLLVVRVVASLGAVLGLLWFLQRRLGRTGGRRTANLINVLSRKGLGRNTSLVIVDAEGQRFVLGVTEQSVTVLNSAPAPMPSFTEAQPREDVGAQIATGPTADHRKAAWDSTIAGSILAPSTWGDARTAVKAIKKRKEVHGDN